MSADEVPPEGIKANFIYRNTLPIWGEKEQIPDELREVHLKATKERQPGGV